MYDDDIFISLWDRIARRVKSKPVFSDESLKELNEKETKKAENPIQNAIDELFAAYDKFQNGDKSEKGEEDMSIRVKDLDEMKKEAEEMNNKLNNEVDNQKETKETSGKYPFNQAAPWVSYAHKLKALFGQDPDIRIDYVEDMNEVRMYITGQDKYEALEYLLPTKKVFGNVTLHIALIPSNEMSGTVDISKTIDNAFRGNPVFSRAIDVQNMFDNMTYVMFHKEVAQYYDDNMADYNGMRSTLYQNIADEVLRDMDGEIMRLPALYGVHFCTEVE